RDSTLPPELVVRELGKTVEVDGVDGDRASSAERLEGRPNDIARWRERDRGVEGLRWLFSVVARPLGPELARALTLPSRSGRYEHPTASVARHLDREKRRR